MLPHIYLLTYLLTTFYSMLQAADLVLAHAWKGSLACVN